MRTVRTMLLGLAVACGAPSALPPATAAPSAAPTATPAGASATPTTAATAAATSPVLGFTLTDVRTGERFRLSDFGGRTVVVQGMAVW